MKLPLPFFRSAPELSDTELAGRPHVVIIGGGFGGKSDPFSHEMVVARLAQITGRPVKTTLTREEVFYTHRGRHPVLMWVRSGVRKDGEILALRSCGFGLREILLPILALAVAVSALTAWLLIDVEIQARRVLRTALIEMTTQGAMIVPGEFKRVGERVVYVRSRDADGRLQAARRSDKLVPCARCGGLAGDPFGYLRVHPGGFTVLLEGGSRERWSDEFVFDYSAPQQDWLLAKAVRSVVDTETGQDKRIELRADDFGEVRFEAFDRDRLPSVREP